MRNILVIHSSPNGAQSHSGGLADRLAGGLVKPGQSIVSRDVGTTPPPHLDQETIAAFYTPEEDRTPEQRDRVALSDELVGELEEADTVVIAAPMHNFSVTGGLKAWIDHIARVGRTFRYTENGPKGLLGGRKVYIVTTRGGSYSPGTPLNHLDQLAPHLRTVLGFVGLDDIEFVFGEGIAKGDDGIKDAEAEIDAIVLETSSAAA